MNTKIAPEIYINNETKIIVSEIVTTIIICESFHDNKTTVTSFININTVREVIDITKERNKHILTILAYTIHDYWYRSSIS